MSDDPGTEASCPQCGEPITGVEGRCPSCGLDFLDDEGGLSPDAVNAMLADVDVDRPGPVPRDGYFTPQWVRLVIGLAISVPMAPLTLFIAESVAPIPLWLGGLVFIGGWLIPGYLLSRRAVPSVIVGTGLLVVGATMAVAPLVIVVGRSLLGTDANEIGALGTNVWTAQSAFLAVGLAVLALGVLVYRHATGKREDWAEAESDE